MLTSLSLPLSFTGPVTINIVLDGLVTHVLPYWAVLRCVTALAVSLSTVLLQDIIVFRFQHYGKCPSAGFMWTKIFKPLSEIVNRITGSYSKRMSVLSKKLPVIFQCACAALQCHQQWRGAPLPVLDVVASGLECHYSTWLQWYFIKQIYNSLMIYNSIQCCFSHLIVMCMSSPARQRAIQSYHLEWPSTNKQQE